MGQRDIPMPILDTSRTVPGGPARGWIAAIKRTSTPTVSPLFGLPSVVSYRTGYPRSTVVRFPGLSRARTHAGAWEIDVLQQIFRRAVSKVPDAFRRPEVVVPRFSPRSALCDDEGFLPTILHEQKPDIEPQGRRHQFTRRRIHQKQSPTNIAVSARKMANSKHWNGQ
jgi:hypothetical protein